MPENIKKETVKQNLNNAKMMVGKLRFKLENSDDLKNIIEEDIRLLKERVEMIQLNISQFRKKIDALPESNDEKNELEKLEEIDFLLFHFISIAEKNLEKYFPNSKDDDKEILLYNPPEEIVKEEQQINKIESAQIENDEKTIEMEKTVFEPLRVLSQPKHYFPDPKGQMIIRPEKYYENNFKNLDLKNLDSALSNPENRFILMGMMNSYLNQADELNYVRKNAIRAFGKILIHHKEDLIPDKDNLTAQDNSVDINNQEILIGIIGNIISDKTFSSLDFSSKKGLTEILLNNLDEKMIHSFSESLFNPQILSYLSVVEENKDSKAYLALNSMIDKAFSENDYDRIQRFVLCTNLAKEKLNTYLINNFQVPLSEFTNSWKINLKEKHFHDISSNIKEMAKIEIAGSGNVKKLVENYGIREFHRYPPEILITQLLEEDKNQPYGLVFFPTDDHNQAFDASQKIFKHIFSKTRGHHGLKIYEVSNIRDVAKALIKNEQKYASENKISFMFLGGHGEKDGITLGPTNKNFKDGNSIENIGNNINITDLNGSGVKKAERFFEKDPSIVLFSCSTGAERGIGQEISKDFKAKVIAPNKPTAIEWISTSYDRKGKIDFKVRYTNRDVEKIYLSGEKIK